nr:MAG TPA: hypothetical protein [Caudoviricetes sp.]
MFWAQIIHYSRITGMPYSHHLLKMNILTLS